jgi:formate dehydrogenase subunit delta
MMNVEKLVKMANDIARFFESEPERNVAVEGVANHIARFWEPRMRREFLAHVDASGGGELRPLVLDAVRTHRERLAPR